ncbi:MAG TPA: hypothetical protein VGN39_15180 [Terriglobales bacterium]|jgi:predicted DNA-binding protein (UPF0251 family)|nr:hypothetical protein [Terriglobales bacterium]
MMVTTIALVEPVTAGLVVPVELEVVENVVVAAMEEPLPESDEQFNAPGSDLWLYRDRTVGILRRYMRLSIEVGRLPSLLGREFFRTRVTSYRVSTFEDAVIFVHDVEKVLERLNAFDKELIGRIVLQDYSQDDAARLMNCGRRTLVRRFPEVLDQISESFLDGGLLRRLPQTTPNPPESCQEAKTTPNELSDCGSSE